MPERRPRGGRWAVDGRFGRAVTAVSGTRVFLAFARVAMPRLDRSVHRLSGGRWLASEGVTHGLLLRSTGAKSGQPRSTPLACFPLDDGLYVVGSNFGRDDHPAWTTNLRVHPRALVSFEGQEFDVSAHLLSAEEKAGVWSELLAAWPNFAVYTARSGRDLRVFRLERG